MRCRVDRIRALFGTLRVNTAAIFAKTGGFLAVLTKNRLLAVFCVSTWLAVACAGPVARKESGMEYARWFKLLPDSSIVVLSPRGSADTLRGPFRRLICMSSSYVGFLEAIGADDAAVGVSGLRYIGNTKVHAVEVGYDAALDYEAILRARPDLFLTYAVSSAEPPYLQKLRELGIRTVVLSEHLESHPLARAEYVKLFGALTGKLSEADSVFSAVRDRYLSLVQPAQSRKVLINIPYAEQWFIPGGENYMTRLIHDAGGELLGAVPGRQESSVIDLETAFRYAQEADCWLHPGWCSSKEQLRAVHPLFAHFPVLDKPVWNNTAQATPGGGNRFWETGPVRPDLVLEDLVNIFKGSPEKLNYYVEVE